MADIKLAQELIEKELRREEGERLKPYLCTAGKPTIGVGCRTYEDGTPVRLTDPPITVERSASLLALKVQRGIGEVVEMTDGNIGTNQLVAFVVCGFNIGFGEKGLRGSTMMRRHKAGDYASAARAFTLWNKYRKGGAGPLVDCKVLTARRLRESAIYMTPDADDGDDSPRMPQAVAAESSLARSPIASSGAIAAGTGVVSIIGQAGDQIGTVGSTIKTAKATVVETLGVPEGAFLPLVLVVAGGVAMFYRWKQRSGGWA